MEEREREEEVEEMRRAQEEWEERARERSSALGYALLFIDLASRILHSPVLHVSCLSWGGGGAGMQGYTCSRSTIWQPESFWRLLPGTPEEELPLFSASKQKQPQW